MKLVQINTVCNGSTGKIMGNIQRMANNMGIENISFYGRRIGYKDLRCEKIGGIFSFWYHVFITTVFDMHGHGSYFKTKKLVKRLKQEKPDIIHLHNIHGYYINYNVLFNYLKKDFSGKIFWTFHDCIPFTGHCSHFMLASCDKWKTQCYKCPNKKRYPISLFFDRSTKNYLEKKALFTGIKNMTIITPSNWMNNIVKKSFLKEYRVITVNNSVDLSLFTPLGDSSIRKKYGIDEKKKILLGVANVWTREKGYEDFLKLANMISNEYIIVMVGLSKAQIHMIKKINNIVGIERTDNQTDLVKLYTAAICFLNLTYEDNYPTVNLESLSCGTPVITYNTGGCCEQITNDTGYVIDPGDINDVLEKINYVEFSEKYDRNQLGWDSKYKIFEKLYQE